MVWWIRWVAVCEREIALRRVTSISAKPASVQLKARPLAKAKGVCQDYAHLTVALGGDLQAGLAAGPGVAVPHVDLPDILALIAEVGSGFGGIEPPRAVAPSDPLQERQQLHRAQPETVDRHQFWLRFALHPGRKNG